MEAPPLKTFYWRFNLEWKWQIFVTIGEFRMILYVLTWPVCEGQLNYTEGVFGFLENCACYSWRDVIFFPYLRFLLEHQWVYLSTLFFLLSFSSCYCFGLWFCFLSYRLLQIFDDLNNWFYFGRAFLSTSSALSLVICFSVFLLWQNP